MSGTTRRNTKRFYLKTDRHDDIRLSFLWLVWLYTRIDQIYQLIEDGLKDRIKITMEPSQPIYSTYFLDESFPIRILPLICTGSFKRCLDLRFDFLP